MQLPSLITRFKTLGDAETWAERIAAAIHQLFAGQSAVCGTVTLTANVTTTTVSNDAIPAAAKPLLQAASGTWTSTVMRVTTVSKGSFVITHSNEAATDRVVHWWAPTPG